MMTEALVRSAVELLQNVWLNKCSNSAVGINLKIKIIGCLGELGLCGSSAGSEANCNAKIMKLVFNRVASIFQTVCKSKLTPTNADTCCIEAVVSLHKYLLALSSGKLIDETDINIIAPILLSLLLTSFKMSQSRSFLPSNLSRGSEAVSSEVVAMSLRCHYELLRCIEVLAFSKPGEICHYLLSKLECKIGGNASSQGFAQFNNASNVGDRLASYIAIRHLATRLTNKASAIEDLSNKCTINIEGSVKSDGCGLWEAYGSIIISSLLASTTRENLPEMKVYHCQYHCGGAPTNP